MDAVSSSFLRRKNIKNPLLEWLKFSQRINNEWITKDNYTLLKLFTSSVFSELRFAIVCMLIPLLLL